MILPARILATSSRLPGTPHTTRALAERALPGRDPRDLERKTGIRTRYWAHAGTRAADLGAEVLTDALDRAGMHPSELRRIVFVSSTGGDMLIPATGNALAERVGIDGTCDTFDLNNACMGFLSAFDVAARSVATGVGAVAVVVVETLSYFLAVENPRPWMVLGDAAGAVILGAAREGEGVLASYTANRGAKRGSVTMAHPGLARGAVRIEFSATNDELTGLATEALRASMDAVLTRANCTAGDLAWVVPHQPNGRMLEKIVEALGVPMEKLVPVVDEIGSVGAASMAVGLDRLVRTRTIAPGDRILLAGVGAGMAYGAMLYRVAP